MPVFLVLAIAIALFGKHVSEVAVMIAIVTVLLCLPVGQYSRSRIVANTMYAVAYLWAFIFQTLYLSLDGSAFGAEEFPWSYGLVALSIFAVGFGLIAAAHEARRRRSAHSQGIGEWATKSATQPV